MPQIDRRFGSWNQFGTTNKYGASTLEAALAWGFEVDWDGDGVFDGTNEATRVCGLRTMRGRTAMLQSTGQGFEPIRTGQAVFTLWNDDGRYDGWNSSSPLYPYVTPGKDVRIRVRNLQASGDVLESVFYGVITDIVPMGYDERPKVNVYVEDGWNFLRNYSARVALQESITIHAAIGLVLDAVGWQERWGRNIASGGDSVRYWWGSGSKNASTECEDLANSVFGNFFIAADGRATYITRTTVTPSAADYTQEEIYKDIQNPQPWVNQRNVTQLQVHVRDQTGTALLYEQFGDSVYIPAGETYVDFVSFTFNGNQVPALSIVAPVASTDYNITANSDGTGTNLNASCTVSVTSLGDRAKRSITNNSGGGAYVYEFRIRGVAVYERNVSDLTYPSDPSNVSSPRKFFQDLPWLQNVNTAQDFCTVYGPFLEAAHPFPVVKMEGNFSKQFGVDLFDIVTLTSDKLGIGGVSFRVGGIEHEAQNEALQRIVTTLYLEPYVSSGEFGSFPLTFGTSMFGW